MSSHYKEAGVDANLADGLVDWLQASQGRTKSFGRGTVVEGIGGFAALFRPEFSKYTDPLLVSGTDGIGTKLLLGIDKERVNDLGIDLVAMCANDVITTGAAPLFFLDYFATGKIAESTFKAILSGIRRGCDMAGALLIGGETAEMPGLYEHGHFDLAGFMVGIVDRPRVLGPQNVKVGDHLIGLESSGFHSNGYSLIRKWLKNKPEQVTDALVEKLLLPTIIYGDLPAISQSMPGAIAAMSHITGGGISGNLPRVLPKGATAQISRQGLPTPSWMKEFIEDHASHLFEVEEVFNLGVGMILVVKADRATEVIKACQERGYRPHRLGQVVTGAEEPSVTFI